MHSFDYVQPISGKTDHLVQAAANCLILLWAKSGCDDVYAGQMAEEVATEYKVNTLDVMQVYGHMMAGRPKV